MMQQINLYQPMFRRQKKVFSAATLLQIASLIAAGMLLLYGYGLWQNRMLAAQLAALEAQERDSAARLAELTRLYAPRQADAALAAQVEQLTAERDAKRRLLETVTAREFGNTQGFAAHFVGLARQRIAGLWLTGIALEKGGAAVTLRGSSSRPELVPRYLQRLGSERAFDGLTFRSMRLSEPRTAAEAAPGAYIDFEISSAALAAPETRRDAP